MGTQVGAKPLIMRADIQLDSDFMTVLRPGQLVTVIEEKAMDDGAIRAKVAMVEEEVASKAIAESWWRPFDPSAIPEVHMAAYHVTCSCLAPCSSPSHHRPFADDQLYHRRKTVF